MVDSINYCSKKDLYSYINQLKTIMKIDSDVIGFDFFDMCKRVRGLKIELVDFTDKSLRGLSLPSDRIILLNSSRTNIERNFDCAHEFIHVVKHKDEGYQTFNCFDKLHPRQNPFLEWQANEGAAEFLVPYKVFIPLFCNLVSNCHSRSDYLELKDYLAYHFYVPYSVITLRIENLKYEIRQYELGRSIDSLEILSITKQEQKGIHIASYNAFFKYYSYIAQ